MQYTYEVILQNIFQCDVCRKINFSMIFAKTRVFSGSFAQGDCSVFAYSIYEYC